MKKILLAVTALFMINAVFAQGVMKTTSLNTVAKEKKVLTGRSEAAPQNVNPMMRTVSRNYIGTTYYDLQTNGTMSNRLAAHNDGTISAIWTTNGGTMASRGTGYNFFNGTGWVNDPFSTDKIETVRAGWGTITCVDDAEIVVSHNGSDALEISICPQKGTENWTHTTLVGPEASNGSGTSTCLLWPAIASSGNTIHLIACTESDAGFLYQGINTCLVYYRGTYDRNTATITWESPRVVGNVNPQDIPAFSGDSYAIAAKGNTVAILTASSWSDVFLWKSTDNGTNFTTTTIFQHPIPGCGEATTLIETDTPYVADGSCAIALDANGDAHVAFGITRLQNTDITDGSYSYFPGVTGMLYWKEGMQPILNSTMNTLDPDSLTAAGYTVFFRSDLNNDGGAYFASGGDLPGYGVGAVSMPQIVIDGNNVYMVYTTLLDWPFMDVSSSLAYYRGVFARKSTDNGNTWDENVSWLSYNKDCYYIDDWTWAQDTGYTLQDLIDMNVIYTDGESVFPAVAPEVVNGKLVMTWQQDYTAGCEIKENNVGMCSNESQIYFLTLDGSEVGVYNNTDEVSQGLWIDPAGINNHAISGMKMYPNPATESVNISFSAENAENGVLTVMNLMGQTVFTNNIEVNEGYNFINLPVNQFTSGVYMVSVRTNTGITTQKLIVK